MYQSQVFYIINLLMLLDGVIFIVGGYFSVHVLQQIDLEFLTFPESYIIGIILFMMFVNNFLMGAFGMYSDRRSPSFLHTLKRLFVVLVLDFSLLNVVLITFPIQLPLDTFLAVYAVTSFALLATQRAILEVVLEKRSRDGFNTRNILVAGSDERAAKVCRALDAQKSWGHKVIGFLKADSKDPAMIADIPCLGDLDVLKSLLLERNVDEVVFALPQRCDVDLKGPIAVCENMGVPYKIVPAMYDPENAAKVRVEMVQDIPVLSRFSGTITPSGLLYKRIVDYVVGAVGFVIFLAVLPFTALAIKIDSPGPIFFKQTRVGQNGRRFQIYKFRSMYTDAEERKKELMSKNKMNGLMFKVDNDPRITRVGRFLRHTSIDELPQFANVLKGEMSLVGTRPPTLDEVEKYEVWHRRRISIRPGITGLWQISGRSKITDFDEVVKLDLQYIDNWNFVTDLKILYKTVIVVLRRKGAI